MVRHTSVRIHAGGQTGVDRAALDVALELGLPCGGWVPAGRRAEDGEIPARYPHLREADSPEPAVRTELNVRDADATLLITRGAPAGGTALTAEIARRLGKPLLRLDLEETSREAAIRVLREWLRDVGPTVLNVAGPRASEDPNIHDDARDLLLEALGPSG